jgi:hypothetical protein
MHNNKLSTTAALVAALVFPGVAVAATDDMGMQYTSASEGLSGSFRVNLYDASDDGTDEGDTTSGASLDSLRLFFNGSADLGNGLTSTYGLQVRAAAGTDSTNTYAQDYHVGLNGVFGSLQFGRIASAAYMVPGGSLDSLKGNSRKAPTEDPGDKTFKFTSPSINGLQFGFSAMMNDDGKTDDDLLDEVAFGATYDTPLGLKLGASYEKEAKTTPTGNNPDHEDDITGFRFGAHYGQDNWTVAYEYRAYDNYAGGIAASVSSVVNGSNTISYGDGKAGNDYQVHAFAVRFNLDKVTASAQYSAEEVSLEGKVSSASDAAAVKDLGRTALGVDVKYALGSKSSILLGFSSTEQDQHKGTGDGLAELGTSKDSDTTTLRYQVDF